MHWAPEEKELKPYFPGAAGIGREKNKTQMNIILVYSFNYCVLSAYPKPGIVPNNWNNEPATAEVFP